MFLKHLLISIIFFTTITCYGKSQNDNNKPPRKHYVGLYIDELFWKIGKETQVELAPFAGYRIIPGGSPGIGVKYLYMKLYDKSSHSIGGFVFLRYIFARELHPLIPLDAFAHTEYEIMNAEIEENKRQNLDYYWAGGGLSQPIGKNGSINFLGLWNIIPDAYNPNDWEFRIHIIF
jgi:hypothetical protein